MIQIEAIGHPITQGSKIKTNWGMRDANGDKLKPWRDTVRAAALDTMRDDPPLDGPVTVVATFPVPPTPIPLRHRPQLQPAEDQRTATTYRAQRRRHRQTRPRRPRRPYRRPRVARRLTSRQPLRREGLHQPRRTRGRHDDHRRSGDTRMTALRNTLATLTGLACIACFVFLILGIWGDDRWAATAFITFLGATLLAFLTAGVQAQIEGRHE